MKWIYGDEKQIAGCLGQSGWGGERGNSGRMEVFTVSCGDGVGEGMHVRAYRSASFKYAQFIVCQLNLSQATKQRRRETAGPSILSTSTAADG